MLQNYSYQKLWILILSSKKGLERWNYHKSQFPPFVFYRKDSVILTYVDNCVIVPHKQETTIALIEFLNNGPENYVLKDEGEKPNYLGVNIKKNQMGNSNHLNQTWWRKILIM